MIELTDDIRKAIHEQLTARPRESSKPNVQRRVGPGIWNKPFHSNALGVAPNQIGEAREEFRKHGLAIDFDQDGRAIITGPKQYKEACRALGIFSGRDGYGIPGEDGVAGKSGRQLEEAKREFREKIRRGEVEF